jgi:hypothetical protein
MDVLSDESLARFATGHMDMVEWRKVFARNYQDATLRTRAHQLIDELPDPEERARLHELFDTLYDYHERSEATIREVINLVRPLLESQVSPRDS